MGNYSQACTFLVQAVESLEDLLGINSAEAVSASVTRIFGGTGYKQQSTFSSKCQMVSSIVLLAHRKISLALSCIEHLDQIYPQTMLFKDKTRFIPQHRLPTMDDKDSDQVSFDEFDDDQHLFRGNNLIRRIQTKNRNISNYLMTAEKTLVEARVLWESLISHDSLFDMLDVLVFIAQIELRLNIKMRAFHYHFYGSSD